MNRHDRRAQEARLRKLRARDPKSASVKLVIEEINEAQQVAGRYAQMVEFALKALQTASSIPVIEKPEGWEPTDGNPNFERDDLLEEAQELHTAAQKNFAGALIDIVRAFQKFDEPAPAITVVPASALGR
jgi:hypothetical protein